MSVGHIQVGNVWKAVESNLKLRRDTGDREINLGINTNTDDNNNT